ncbi:MAG: hypothetical protein RL154_1064 [Pseudomonadota bacterium]
MNRLLTFLLFFTLTASLAQTTPQTSSYPAIAYVVKEVGAKDILMSKNQNSRIAPASLTKVLTCSIALELSDLNAQVTVPQEATLVEPSKAGFKAGEVFTMHDLIEAALVHSANDAAYTIAYHIGGGDINKFVVLMNAKAQSLGMVNSHFTNPAGFDIADHYSTAADLLKLAEFAIKNRTFNETVKMHSTTITAINTGHVYKMKTSNKLLDKYPYAVGIKTGYTKKAGPCLIARAKKDNKDVLVVLLKSKVSRWGMVENIFEKAYDMKEPEMEVREDIAVPGASYQKLANNSSKAKKAKLAKKQSVAKKTTITRKQPTIQNRQKVANHAQVRNAN